MVFLLLVGLTWLLASTLFGGEGVSFLKSFFIGEKMRLYLCVVLNQVIESKEVLKGSSNAKCMLHNCNDPVDYQLVSQFSEPGWFQDGGFLPLQWENVQLL